MKVLSFIAVQCSSLEEGSHMYIHQWHFLTKSASRILHVWKQPSETMSNTNSLFWNAKLSVSCLLLFFYSHVQLYFPSCNLHFSSSAILSAHGSSTTLSNFDLSFWLTLFLSTEYASNTPFLPSFGSHFKSPFFNEVFGTPEQNMFPFSLPLPPSHSLLRYFSIQYCKRLEAESSRLPAYSVKCHTQPWCFLSHCHCISSCRTQSRFFFSLGAVHTISWDPLSAVHISMWVILKPSTFQSFCVHWVSLLWFHTSVASFE